MRHRQKPQRWILLLIGIVAFWSALPGRAAHADGEAIVTDHALLEPLRKGGLTVVLRRAQMADRSVAGSRGHRDHCADQVGVSKAGWSEARAIGLTFEAQGISVDRVLAAPDCGSRQTAQLAFGADRVVVLPELAGLCVEAPNAAKTAKAVLRDRVARSSTINGNWIVVLPGCAFTALRRAIWPACTRAIEPLDGLVLRPVDDDYALLGCIAALTFERWRGQKPQAFPKR